MRTNSMDKDKQPAFIKDPNKTYGLMEIVDGTSPMVEKAPEDTVETFPHYLLLLTICSLAVTFVLLIISLFFDAPLEELANPLVTPNPGKAPWYFTGIQELIHYTNKPVIPAIIIPLLIVVWLFLIPYIDREPRTPVTSLFKSDFYRRAETASIAFLIHLFCLRGLDLHPHRFPLQGGKLELGLSMEITKKRNGYQIGS